VWKEEKGKAEQDEKKARKMDETNFRLLLRTVESI
jgi:hypothetical protein